MKIGIPKEAEANEKRVAATLGLGGQHVNVKAKTADGLGFIGRGEGIGALCVATLESA